MANANPLDALLVAAARTYIAAKAALGTTVDPRSLAAYQAAQVHYERVTGARWSGNP